MNVVWLLCAYIGTLTLAGFLMMGIDKRKAIKHTWRIPEASLFIVAMIGGSAGVLLGMYAFRHKTRHIGFVYGIPAILILQIAAITLLIRSPLQFKIL